VTRLVEIIDFTQDVFERGGLFISIGIMKIKYADLVRFESLERLVECGPKLFWAETMRFRRIYPA
jgi:hypothetical protein